MFIKPAVVCECALFSMPHISHTPQSLLAKSLAQSAKPIHSWLHRPYYSAWMFLILLHCKDNTGKNVQLVLKEATSIYKMPMNFSPVVASLTSHAAKKARQLKYKPMTVAAILANDPMLLRANMWDTFHQNMCKWPKHAQRNPFVWKRNNSSTNWSHQDLQLPSWLTIRRDVL